MNSDARGIARRFSDGMSGGGEQTVMRLVLRSKRTIVAFAVAMTCVAFLIVRGLPVRYTADASVELGAPQLQVLNNTSVVSAPTLDLDRLRTEMEAFRSPSIARAVVEQLHLANQPEFCEPPPARLMTRITSLWERHAPAAGQHACAIDVDTAAKKLATMVGINNDGRSYIVHVSAEAGGAELAAAIANSYADAYVAEQRQRMRGDMEMADEWLGTYLSKLRRQTHDADAAVAAYREQHQLTPLRGETLVAQSLAELNSQLTLATSQLAEKQAVLNQVQGLAHGAGSGLGASAPAMASPVVQNLLEKRAEALSQAAYLQSQYGSAYPAVQSAQAQVTRLNQQIGAEVGKSVSALAGEVAALAARRSALTAQVQGLQDSVAHEQQEDVHLQQLRREADADQQLYQAMTIRLKEIDAEQGMQRAGAHVVVGALRPDLPSFPRTKMMLAGSFMAALGIGAGAAVAGGFLSRRYRDIQQVELETGLRVLGLFPRPRRRGAAHDAVVDRPTSLEAEALQAILIGLTRRVRGATRPTGHTVMVVSALPAEGKTSFALALGRAATAASLSVAVVDCDLRRPSLRRLAEARPGRKGGKTAPTYNAQEAPDPRSGLQIIPIAGDVCSPQQLLGARWLDPVIAKLRKQYDLIILDTPPVLAVPDALNLAPLADDVLLLISWQQTPRGAVDAAVDRLRRNTIDIAGIVLTKVDLRTFQRSGDGFGYYAKHYPGYTDTLALTDARV